MSTLEKVLLNNVEYTLGGSGGGEHKTPEYYTVTLTPAVVLENTRVSGNSAQTVSGYTTYLFPFEVMTDAGHEALISTTTGWASYYGYYDGTSSYTYTNTTEKLGEFPVVNSNHTGFFVSSGEPCDFTYYYALGIGNNEGYKHDSQKGFRTISSPNLSFKASGTYIQIAGLPNDGAYIVDFYNAVPSNCYQKASSSVSIAGTYLALTAITKQYMFANLAKAPCLFEFRPNQQGANLRALCERGAYLWELNDISEIVAARSNIPKVVLVHQGNWLDKVIFAMAQGWSGVECDVRTTSDGVCIFSHGYTVGNNNLDIATHTYAECLSVAPNLMTVDELLKLIGKFKGWVDFHWQAVDDDVKLDHIKKAYGYKVPFVMYYGGSQGTYIGDTITIQDFWKTGISYANGISEIDQSHPNIKYNIGNDLCWSASDLASSVELNYTKLTDGTYDEYNFLFSYFHTPCLYQ